MPKRERTEAVSLFRYFTDGSTEVEANPDPPSPNEAKPFHVVIREEGWIPVSVLVFARNDEHALMRLRDALDECLKGQYIPDHPRDHDDPHRAFASRFLKAIDNYQSSKPKRSPMWVEVSPLDTGLICAEVNWASNGGPL